MAFGDNERGLTEKHPPPNETMTKNLFLDAMILIGMAAACFAGYRMAPLLDPKTDSVLPMSSCNLGEQPCAVALVDGRQLDFSIEPRPIRTLNTLTLRASLTGDDINKVEVDFVGSTMKMGYNRPRLTRLSEHDTRFVGQATLPVCVTGTMEWQATVLVDTGKAVIAAPFRFSTAP